MQLRFADMQETSILVTLGEGEVFGDWQGPREITVPVDENNRDYQALHGLEIGPYVPPPTTPTGMPEVISDRQFFQAAAIKGLITEEEALAAVRTGTLPDKLRDFVAGVTDPEQHFAIEMTLSGATQFERHHPLVDMIGHALGYSDEQMDALWELGGSL